jgi:hypothetical protein
VFSAKPETAARKKQAVATAAEKNSRIQTPIQKTLRNITG